MNTENKIRKALTKGDVLLIVFLSAICLLWFLLSFAGENENLRLEIYLDGEVQVSVNLSSLDGEIYTVGGCEIYADKNGVKFISSHCEDSLCIKRGLMSRQGDTMACVPERVVVTLRGETKTDAITF